LKNLEFLKKESSKLTEKEIKEALEKGLDEYCRNYKEVIYKNPQEQLQRAREELAAHLELLLSLDALAESHANKMLYAGLTIATGQLVGMAALIFGIYSWEVMEPITYLVCKSLF